MKKIIATTLLASALATPALAEGVYVGAQGGSATYKFSNMPTSASAVGALVGYQIDSNWAVEAAYNSYGSSTANNNPGLSVKATAVSLGAVVSAPLSDSFSIYARLGVANVSADRNTNGFVDNTSTTGLATGLGAQFNFNSQFGVRLGYDINKIGVGNVSANLTNLNGALIVKF